jgi:hypothetical protein
VKQKEYHECSVEKGFCPTLEKFTQSDRHTKGLSWFTVMPSSFLDRKSFSLNELKTIGVIYKENAKSNGIMLNYCPFCGKDLRPFRTDYVKKEI